MGWGMAEVVDVAIGSQATDDFGAGWGVNGLALVGEGLLAGGLGWPAEFTMDFVLVGVGDEGIEETVGGGEFAEAFCGEEGAEAFLPVVVAAFDFAFGLRGWEDRSWVARATASTDQAG